MVLHERTQAEMITLITESTQAKNLLFSLPL
jgi:hypothetical protein